MNRHSKIVATLFFLVVIVVVATILVRREANGTKPHEVAAASTKRALRTMEPSVAMDTTLTLEQWQQRIRDHAIGDFRTLMDAALKIDDPDLRNAIIIGITDRWLREDPSNFTRYMATLEVGGDEAKLAVLALALQNSLTKLTPEQAASDEILVMVQRLIAHLAVSDPDLALAWTRKWLLDDTMENALASVARGFAKTDIKKALEVIDSMKSALRRGQALATVGGIWAMTAPRPALEWAMTLSNPAERALTLNQVLLAVAKVDPAAASQALKQQAQLMNEQYQKYRAEDLASRGVAEVDEANDPETYREMMESGALLAPSSPDVELMSDAGRAIASVLAAADGENGVNWAESLETDFLKLKSITGGLEGWAKSEPHAALAYLNANHPGNQEMLKSVYHSWASVDPQAAADGVERVSPAERTVALEAVIKSWVVKGDPLQAASYINDLPAAEVSDSTKTILVNAMSGASPQQAWGLARTITDPKAQFRALKNAFSHLVIQSPAQAEALLTTSSLSNDHSDRLQDVLDAVVEK